MPLANKGYSFGPFLSSASLFLILCVKNTYSISKCEPIFIHILEYMKDYRGLQGQMTMTVPIEKYPFDKSWLGPTTILYVGKLRLEP